MTDSIVRVWVSPESKAAANANALGLDLSTIIRMVVNRLVASSELPADLPQLIKKTLQAIRDLNTGNEVTHVETVDDLKRNLGWSRSAADDNKYINVIPS